MSLQNTGDNNEGETGNKNITELQTNSPEVGQPECHLKMLAMYFLLSIPTFKRKALKA